jgi:hypothetical protein
VEEFAVPGAKEILFGRDSSCDIRFDQDRDEFVSRRHIKLVIGGTAEPEFSLVDLGALNGTFVNRRRVTGSAVLKSGDLVQLGAGGPEFTFDVVADDLRITPLSGIASIENPSAIGVAENPVPANAPPEAEVLPSACPVPPKARSVKPVRSGRKIRKRSSPRASIAGLMVLVLAATWYFVGSRDALRHRSVGAVTRALKVFWSSETLTPEEVSRKSAEFLVTAETVWKLVDSATGRPLKQIYIPNRREQSDSGSAPLIPDSGPELPVFVLLAGNRLQPLLTVADQGPYQVIGGKSRGAGFILAPGRLVLTCRSVTSPWHVPYDWPPGDTAGIVAVFDRQHRLIKTAIIARRQFPRWLPVETDFVLESALDQNAVRVNGMVHGKGLSESLMVHIPIGRLDVHASLVKESDETGFAAVQMDAQLPTHGIGVATEVEPKLGDELVTVASAEAQSAMGKVSAIDPVGRYELAVDMGRTAGAGSPVFDRYGRLVAVQIGTDPLLGDRAFAISIRRALESVGQASTRRSVSPPFKSPRQSGVAYPRVSLPVSVNECH